MNNFDKVIGYDAIKKELLQICDMVKNKSAYEKLGAKFPRGVLLYGDPGLGKTLMAKCFIAECNLETFTIRKTKSENFVEHISKTFEKAKEKAPAIIFLDDMDKFANEDNDHINAEEYIAVQSGIDNVKESDVFVIATVNEFDKMPNSLTRSGRFDRCIEVFTPNSEDCEKIISYYLKDKKVDEDINVSDISKMITYSSCAELETMMNEAAIIAAYERKPYIEMADIVKAYLKTEYNSPDDFTKITDTKLERIAYHEVGHAVMSELLCPGSVGLVSVRKRGRNSTGGFVRRCVDISNQEHLILISLAGKASYELMYGSCDEGSGSDIQKACECIGEEISENGNMGFGMVDVETPYSTRMSEVMNARTEAVIQAEMAKYMFKAKEILIKNREFIEKTVEMLLKKETLLASDIKAIKDSLNIVSVD